MELVYGDVHVGVGISLDPGCLSGYLSVHTKKVELPR